MSFIDERYIKATRKRHVCNACDKWIEVGEAAVHWVGVTDGDFGCAYYHPDCREAEVAYNRLRGYRFGDDWFRLCEDAEPEDYSWLKSEHPIPYKRMLMTREQWAGTREAAA